MEQLTQELSTKMDAGLAVILIVFTGIVMFNIGLMTPFIVSRIVKAFSFDFGEFFDKEDEEKPLSDDDYL